MESSWASVSRLLETLQESGAFPGAVAILAASTGLGDHSVVEFLSAFSQFFSFAAWGYFAYRVARWFLPSIVGVRRPPPPPAAESDERYYD